MKRFAFVLLATASCMSLPQLARAEENAFGLDFSGNAGLVSDYVFRGISQTDESPALQGGFDVTHTSGLYAGLWGSNVDFNDGDEAQVEIDFYGGYATTINNVSLDGGLLYYSYPGADDALDYDYWELSAAAGYDFGPFSSSLSFNFSPNNFADSGHAEYVALAVDVPLPYELSLNGHVGYQMVDDNAAFAYPDYTDWALGVAYNFEGFDLSAQYTDTDMDESDCADGCDSKFVVGVSRSF